MQGVGRPPTGWGGRRQKHLSDTKLPQTTDTQPHTTKRTKQTNNENNKNARKHQNQHNTKHSKKQNCQENTKPQISYKQQVQITKHTLLLPRVIHTCITVHTYQTHKIMPGAGLLQKSWGETNAKLIH